MDDEMMSARRHLKILRSVVVSLSVEMMDDLVSPEASAQELLCDQPMFAHIAASSVGMPRHPPKDVAVALVFDASVPQGTVPGSKSVGRVLRTYCIGANVSCSIFGGQTGGAPSCVGL